MLCRGKYLRAQAMLSSKSVKEVAEFFNVDKKYIAKMKKAFDASQKEVVEPTPEPEKAETAKK